MKTRAEVSAEKLRGGFYSPDALVRFCLQRVQSLVQATGRPLALLEPSAGDGAFLRGLRGHPLGTRIAEVAAIELLESEARKCEAELRGAPFDGSVYQASFVRWAVSSRAIFDVAVGNPPFVRFQFVDGETKADVSQLGTAMGVSFRGVSNLWLPVLLGSLGMLRPGGAFAFIVPAESFTGISGGVIREWLVAHVDGLRFDLFPPGSFPRVLQEVVVMSGVRRGSPRAGPAPLIVSERDSLGSERTWEHHVKPGLETWTGYLLEPRHLDALERAREIPSVRRIAEVAKFEVAAVTGANAFFSVDRDTIDLFELGQWVVPLLPRARHAPGLRYSASDHEGVSTGRIPAALLNFSEDRPDPIDHPGVAKYLALGERQGLHQRYKTRIRQPWYRIPLVKPGRLMLSKRCHRYPRVILNDAGVVTTDTIYRGWMQPGFEQRDLDLVAAFHNSLTLLTAEIEGRSFGGGVLELVPSEIARLLIPLPEELGEELGRLDQLARELPATDGEALVEETDLLLRKVDGEWSEELLDTLRDARERLLSRRLDRN